MRSHACVSLVSLTTEALERAELGACGNLVEALMNNNRLTSLSTVSLRQRVRVRDGQRRRRRARCCTHCIDCTCCTRVPIAFASSTTAVSLPWLVLLLFVVECCWHHAFAHSDLVDIVDVGVQSTHIAARWPHRAACTVAQLNLFQNRLTAVPACVGALTTINELSLGRAIGCGRRVVQPTRRPTRRRRSMCSPRCTH